MRASFSFSQIAIYEVNPTKQRQQIAAMNDEFPFKSNQPQGLLLDRSCGICQEHLGTKFLYMLERQSTKCRIAFSSPLSLCVEFLQFRGLIVYMCSAVVKSVLIPAKATPETITVDTSLHTKPGWLHHALLLNSQIQLN